MSFIFSRFKKSIVLPEIPGCVVIRALYNAHDHLELNHYPRSKYRDRYDNAHQWGEDVNEHLNESLFRRLRAYPLSDRLFIGGLKNLLCGALNVAHHNPPHRELFRRDFPVRVVRRYGWAHSLHFSTDAEVVKAYRRTPKNALFFIHLAEGTDDIAAGEYKRLKALGCVGGNTVIVHGVGLTDGDIADAAPRVHSLVTCPTTNHYLLGKTANLDAWRAAGGRVWIGSDSRLTAEGDLLDEINFLTLQGTLGSDALQNICMRLSDVAYGQGRPYTRVRPNMQAAEGDWIAVREGAQMPIQRADLAVVIRGGVPQIGDPDVMAQFANVPTVRATLDGKPKAIHHDLAQQIKGCALQEPGLSLE